MRQATIKKNVERMAIRFFFHFIVHGVFARKLVAFFPFSNNLMEEKLSVRLHTVAWLIYIVWDFCCMSVFCDLFGRYRRTFHWQSTHTYNFNLGAYTHKHTHTQHWYKYTENPNEFYANEKGEKSRTKTKSLYFDYKRSFFLVILRRVWFFVLESCDRERKPWENFTTAPAEMGRTGFTIETTTTTTTAKCMATQSYCDHI